MQSPEVLEKYKLNTVCVTGHVEARLYGVDENPLISEEFAQHHNKTKPAGFTLVNENDPNMGNSPCINVVVSNGQNPQVQSVSSTEFYVKGSLSDPYFRLNLPHVVYNLAEGVRIQNLNMVTAHASAVVTQEGNAILVLGDKGSGKTSLILSLCKFYGCRLVGDDLLLIQDINNGVYVAGGCQTSYMRPYTYSQLYSEGKDYKSRRSTSENPYEEKIMLYNPETSIQIADSSPKRVSSVVRVNIHPSNQEENSVGLREKTREYFRLKENFSLFIRGMKTVLGLDQNGMYGTFPSLDSSELEEVRNVLISDLLSNHKFDYVYGRDPIRTCEYILSHLIN